MAQQTAVEWLQNELFRLEILDGYSMFEIFEKAKEMEKHQLEEAYLNGCFRVTTYGYYNDSAEQYYKETYGS